MDMGDAAGWAAFAISVGAFGVSIRAQRDGRRSANAAEETVKEARRAGDAAVRSAVAAELTLADQRREAAEQRAAEEEASRPRAVLHIEHSRKAVWQLINSGTAAALRIRLAEQPTAIMRGWEGEVSLDPGDVHEFTMAGSSGSPIPAVMRLIWDGREQPVLLRVPPRIG